MMKILMKMEILKDPVLTMKNLKLALVVGLGEKNLQLGLEAELKEDYTKAIYYFELVNQRIR
jgi:hypothetical protein